MHAIVDGNNMLAIACANPAVATVCSAIADVHDVLALAIANDLIVAINKLTKNTPSKHDILLQCAVKAPYLLHGQKTAWAPYLLEGQTTRWRTG